MSGLVCEGYRQNVPEVMRVSLIQAQGDKFYCEFESLTGAGRGIIYDQIGQM